MGTTQEPGGANRFSTGPAELAPYQYIVLRCVPRVEREEFLNVGVVVYCQALDYLCAAAHLDPRRLATLAPGLDLEAVQRAMEFTQAVCRADERVGVVAGCDAGTRFGFLKAPRSTVVQPGPVHGGQTLAPEAELALLLDRLVR